MIIIHTYTRLTHSSPSHTSHPSHSSSYSITSITPHHAHAHAPYLATAASRVHGRANGGLAATAVDCRVNQLAAQSGLNSLNKILGTESKQSIKRAIQMRLKTVAKEMSYVVCVYKCAWLCDESKKEYWLDVHAYLWVCMCEYVCVLVCTCIFIYAFVRVYVSVFVCVCACVRVACVR